jgi:hypothetical protein
VIAERLVTQIPPKLYQPNMVEASCASLDIITIKENNDCETANTTKNAVAVIKVFLYKGFDAPSRSC